MLEFRDYKGTPVILTEECWKGHILLRHPEIKRFLKEVRLVVENPDVWRESEKDENVILYYKSGIIKGKYSGLYLVVVVRYVENKRKGYVATAYLTRKPKEGYWR